MSPRVSLVPTLIFSVIAETFKAVARLPRRPLRSPSFAFPMFESAAGRSLESGCSAGRSAGRQRMCRRCRTRPLQPSTGGDLAYDRRIDRKVETVTPLRQNSPKQDRRWQRGASEWVTQANQAIPLWSLWKCRISSIWVGISCLFHSVIPPSSPSLWESPQRRKVVLISIKADCPLRTVV